MENQNQNGIQMDANIYIDMLMQELMQEKKEKIEFKTLYLQTLKKLQELEDNNN